MNTCNQTIKNYLEHEQRIKQGTEGAAVPKEVKKEGTPLSEVQRAESKLPTEEKPTRGERNSTFENKE